MATTATTTAARTATTTAAKTAPRTTAKPDVPLFCCTRYSSWIIDTEAKTLNFRLQCQTSGRPSLLAGTSDGTRFFMFFVWEGSDTLGLSGGVFGEAEGVNGNSCTFGRVQQERALQSCKGRTVYSATGSTTALGLPTHDTPSIEVPLFSSTVRGSMVCRGPELLVCHSC